MKSDCFKINSTSGNGIKEFLHWSPKLLLVQSVFFISKTRPLYALKIFSMQDISDLLKVRQKGGASMVTKHQKLRMPLSYGKMICCTIYLRCIFLSHRQTYRDCLWGGPELRTR